MKTYSRRIARALRKSQVGLMEEFLPQIQVSVSQDFLSLRDGYKEVILEIGFGNGEFAAHFALANPSTLYIGAEPFLNGVASLLWKTKNAEITNIRIFPDDVRILLDKLPRSYLDKIFIICPDPWPKKRHHKRRLVQKALLDQLSQYLTQSGTVEVITDHLGYAEWILDESLKCESLKLGSSKLKDHKELEANWLYTKYQRRGLELGSCIYRFVLYQVDKILF